MRYKIILVIGLFLLFNEAYTQTIKRITATEFHSFLEGKDRDKLTIIDGRDSSMFYSGHIMGAINLNAFAKSTQTKLAEFIDQEQLIVYCTNYTRTETLVDLLSKSGYNGEIIFVTDGITGWKKNGFDIVSNDPEKASKPMSKVPQELLLGLKPIVQVFGTASYDIENNLYNYSFGRAHLGFQYQFNEKWSAKIIIDRGRATTVGEITVSNSSGEIFNVKNTSSEGAFNTMFLKFASLQWKLNNKLTLEGGAILQNHYMTQEQFWGFRYVAQTFQDLYWNIPSSDLGFIVYYKLSEVFSVDAALTNGEGPRKIQDSFGKVKISGGITIDPSEKLRARLYYHNRKSGRPDLITEQMYSVFIGYKPLTKFRFGGEFNYMENLNNINSLNSYGFSFYSTYRLTAKTEFFARFDRIFNEAPDNFNTDANRNGCTIMGGISHSPVKGVNISLNYQGWLPNATEIQNVNNILLSMEYKF
ncbi:MAG: rhodanese-like domain-containing protein [Bacteroidetes bacterium]|nr:rhodanese-like domain-containing protein [Bacteroidota bacterium]